MKGDILGRYRLLERIGIGGMAEVFVARQMGGIGFGKSVVVKRMLPQLASDEGSVAMFLDEAKLGAKLQHPHIVAVLDLGEADGDAFMVLEYVDGADLGVLQSRARARGVVVPVEHAAWIVAKVAQGLHFAHKAVDPETRAPMGIVHRDVSPSNVLLSKSGDIKIADFGVARSNLQSVRTGTGAVKGKISYMSPEQLTGGHLDGRSDVYALGIVLWELLAGDRLHAGKNDAQVIQAVQRELPPPPSLKNPAVPPVLDALVLNCLARSPDRRPASGFDVADTLEKWLSGQPGTGAIAYERWLAQESALFDAEAGPNSGTASSRRTPVSAAKPIGGDRTVPMLRKVGSSSTTPAAPSSSSTPSAPLKLAAKGPERKRELVLYVEDEPENRDVAELRLKRSYDLLLAATDEEAGACLVARGAELKAILMDIQLKGSVLDGIELVKLVRGTLPETKKPAWAKAVPVLKDVPIFFVTAFGSRYSEAELLAAGAQKLVTKPVNFSELTLALVDGHLKRAKQP